MLQEHTETKVGNFYTELQVTGQKKLGINSQAQVPHLTMCTKDKPFHLFVPIFMNRVELIYL